MTPQLYRNFFAQNLHYFAKITTNSKSSYRNWPEKRYGLLWYVTLLTYIYDLNVSNIKEKGARLRCAILTSIFVFIVCLHYYPGVQVCNLHSRKYLYWFIIHQFVNSSCISGCHTWKIWYPEKSRQLHFRTFLGRRIYCCYPFFSIFSNLG